MKYQNPVLRGMYPDPSVCRAGDKYYMVCSTFQYFPGVPLFESEDMVNWKQIGHCLTRASQVKLNGVSTSGGIYAPTIRYHEGRFYMVTTNTTDKGNFYVYTDDIYGEWSEPVWVEQDGIDPSLFFEDGKSYFISNGYDEATGRPCIQMCEIDIETGKRMSETKALWHGTGGRYLEAPHLYKFGEYYYILDAEGGTEYGHMVNYARSKNMWGPFEAFPGNPVLTNRNLGGYILQGAGHGDVLEDKNGHWWFMHLAFRQIDRWMPFHHLGRESCLVPVAWKDDWFYIGDGTSQLSYELPEREAAPQQIAFEKNIGNLAESHEWCFLRNYIPENHMITKESIRLKGTADTLFGLGLPTFAGIRQSELSMYISATLQSECEEAGLTLFMDEGHHYDLFLDGESNAVLRLSIGSVSADVKKVHVGKKATLKVEAKPKEYHFLAVSGEEDNSKSISMGVAETRYLSSEVACGFTGVMVGLYAVDKAGKYAEFTEFSLRHDE
ncbi:MAG: glycoside hydrolase family 43 protein [Lachnospiraceae bacterium]|nr:glycoside hydrolase family 43 protein [Lachnospiraceae bacterium]